MTQPRPRRTPQPVSSAPANPDAGTADTSALWSDLRLLIDGARQRAAAVVNAELTLLY
jgi:hypothetical protein